MFIEIESYKTYLDRLPISRHTRRNYLLRVRRYVEWLEQSGTMKALTDPVERDFAVQDYKAWLLRQGASANTLNSILASIDNFYMFNKLGPAKVKRLDLPAHAPRALEPDEQRRLLKQIAQCKSLRNRAIALIMLNCALRIGELNQLNVGDLILTARKRELVVRCGKGTKRRTVPINSELAEVLREYLADLPADPDAPLFVSQKGNRLSVQGIDYVIRAFGRDAGIDFSAHNLRHSCLTRLIRCGVDIVTVAEIAGHSRLETSRRYSLPTEAVKVNAMERLVDGSATA
jgi:site-specific recombinase XerD